jgi:hypothetical protein
MGADDYSIFECAGRESFIISFFSGCGFGQGSGFVVAAVVVEGS